MTKDCDAGNIYITAFQDFKTYKKFANSIAWDTEVWLSESPEHMIHLNGDRFMGPRD
ncbi:BsuBI/PstI family type II restriction endonuclease [Streptococcus suis]|uniref:BsuBI/PstI family type II restriction endonuclease n=1 Tax=Streptococcus suis TaxID=1307 RepID=UPI003132A3BB